MVFSSLPFLYAFLPLAMVLWVLAPKILRNGILLFASVAFYFLGMPSFVPLLLGTALLNWIFGLLLEKYRGKKMIAFAVGANLLILGFFKYTDFIIATLNQLLGLEMPLPNIPLPIGISFFVFQSMSYVIDVHRGDVAVEKNLGKFATYVSFFPQLIAGPIVRYGDISEGLNKRQTTLEDVSEGVFRFTIGLGKKVLIANQMDAIVNTVRGSGEESVLFFWLYAVAFTLQIYFDFSGYSDMAIGLGRIFGFHFPENFQYPYISKSITEFWRRWHMTLGGWFRDYVYIPLGGNRGGKAKWFRNIAIVWLLTGLWHGAAWNFVFWGLYYGALLMIEKLFLGKFLEKHAVFSHVYVVLLTIFGFVLFNANGFAGLGADFAGLFGLGGIAFAGVESVYYLRSYGGLLVVAVFAATPMGKKLLDILEEKPVGGIVKLLLMAGILLLSTAFLVDGSFNPFLYFRF